MGKYLLRLTAFVLALLLPFAAFFFWVQSKPAQFTGSIMGTLQHKVHLLQDTPGPRIILAGGSSSPYATNCATIGEALGMPCINVGVTAYFGIDFYLNMLKNEMRSGDIIVLAPEVSMLNGTVGYGTLWAGIENHPGLLREVPARYWPEMATHFISYAEDKLALLREGIQPEEYHSHFGPLGDVTIHRELILESGYNREDPIAIGPEHIDEDVLASLRRFAARAAQKGVKVYLAFAPVNALAITTPEAEWISAEETLREGVSMPVLGTWPAAVMPSEYFFDSNNHLNTRGASIYSEELVYMLKQVL